MSNEAIQTPPTCDKISNVDNAYIGSCSEITCSETIWQTIWFDIDRIEKDTQFTNLINETDADDLGERWVHVWKSHADWNYVKNERFVNHT